MATSLDHKLQMRELELQALFETIRAINDNYSEESLYRIYKFINSSNTNIKKLVLFVHDDESGWKAQVSFGVEIENNPDLDLALEFLNVLKISNLQRKKVLNKVPFFKLFDNVLPIRHKENTLAYVLIEQVANSELDMDFLLALSNIIIVAIENKKLARKQKKQEALRRQLDIAKDVQSLLFPKTLPNSERLKVTATYQPHHSVGGDYYDFIQIDPDTFLVCIADVAGKGVPAAILMSNFQAALRVIVNHTTNLQRIVEELNRLILENSGGGSFITSFFMIYNFKTQVLSYINAGHNAPILFKDRGKSIERLNAGTTILGSFSPLPFIETSTVENLEQFLVFCFTDGFTETHNESGEEFGEKALTSFILQRISFEPQVLHSELLKSLTKFKGKNNFIDDITLLSCWVNK